MVNHHNLYTEMFINESLNGSHHLMLKFFFSITSYISPELVEALIQFPSLTTILDLAAQYWAMSWTLTIGIKISVHLQIGVIQK